MTKINEIDSDDRAGDSNIVLHGKTDTVLLEDDWLC